MIVYNKSILTDDCHLILGATNIRKTNSKNKTKKMSSDINQFNSSHKEWKPCNCAESIQKTMNSMSDETTLDGGCENSAILHHGSYIRIGCLQFAFTVVDYLNNDASNGNNSGQQENTETSKGLDPKEREVKHEVDEENHVVQGETSEAASECEDTSQASDSMEIDP